MSDNILSNNKFDLVQENKELSLHFKTILGKPMMIFEALENYLYESQGEGYIEQLAQDIIKNTAAYDQRLSYSMDQEIAGPREAFYLEGSYYCQNHNRNSGNILDDIKFAIGMYSEGKSTKGIALYLDKVLQNSEFKNINLKDRSQYCLISSVICLIRLLDLTTHTSRKDLDILAKKDRLLEMFYFNKSTPDINIPILHQDPYLFLSMELTTRDQHIEQYCKNYYHSMKRVSWYETHRSNFSEFFGYWSFEMAYVVKFMAVEDAQFVDHMYYPRDLAMKKWLPTWKEDAEGEAAREYKRKFLKQKPEVRNALTKEILLFVEKELEQTINVMLSTDLFNKAMSKISESQAFFESITEDPSESEMVTIRTFIKDLVDVLGDYSGEIKQNKQLKELEKELKDRAAKHFEKEDYNPREVEYELHEYFGSETFSITAQKNHKRVMELSDELLHAQSIEEAGQYWDELEKIFNKYRLLNRGKEKDPKSSIEQLKEEQARSKNGDVSFRISFNDYL